MGLLLLLIRPAAPLPRSITFAAFALALGAALAFLPVDWFGRAEWRTTVEAYGNVALGSMVTPQPWHTLQGLGMILAGIAFGLFLLCQPVNGQTHERLAGAFTLGVGAYAGFSIFAACTGWRQPRDVFGTFGFLPNRNHVGTLLAMGAVSGLGTFWNHMARRRWAQALPLGAAILLIVIATLNFCASRAAAVLLFAGLFLWLAGVFRRTLDRRVALSALVLMLFALAVFITSQTPAMQRLKQTVPSPDPLNSWDQPGDENLIENSPSPDFRLLLDRDTCRMIADHPFTGIGLGNYRYLSQQYRDASLSQYLAIHPDNSWLLLAAETGLPATAAAVVRPVGQRDCGGPFPGTLRSGRPGTPCGDPPARSFPCGTRLSPIENAPSPTVPLPPGKPRLLCTIGRGFPPDRRLAGRLASSSPGEASLGGDRKSS